MKNGTQHLEFTDNTESKQAAWADIVDIDAELTVQPGSIQARMKLSPNSAVTDISDVGLYVCCLCRELEQNRCLRNIFKDISAMPCNIFYFS